MAEAHRKSKASRGSQALKAQLAKRNATAELARRLEKSSGMVSRWATGKRQPSRADMTLMERDLELRIPASWWGDPAPEEAASSTATPFRAEAPGAPPRGPRAA